MRIEAAILMHDENTRQFRHGSGPRISAERTDEIAFDAPVPFGRWNSLVAGLDPIVGLRHLLRQGIVRHQRLDDRSGRETGDSKSFRAVQKVAPADLSVNVAVV